MDYEETREWILLKDIADFEPEHIFECGQCFRWRRAEDGSYGGVAGGIFLRVKKERGGVLFAGIDGEQFEWVWSDYFDLGRDYGRIKERLSGDPILEQAVKTGYGIRILRQDPWETLISFIISANNNIPRIRNTIERLCSCYGNKLEHRGETYYGFPTADRLASLTEQEIKGCGCGFRGRYILEAAQKVAAGEADLYRIGKQPTEDARKSLMRFRGVGPKVADCVLLFSMGKYDAFPVDVWVKRVMEHFYLKRDADPGCIKRYAARKFGDLSGFAQQYLFYYARDKLPKEVWSRGEPLKNVDKGLNIE